MSKLTKTVGKWKLWTVVSAIIVAAGIIVAAIFGFNADYTASDVKTMTAYEVSVSKLAAFDNAEDCDIDTEVDLYTLQNQSVQPNPQMTDSIV